MIAKKLVKLVLERDGETCQINLAGCQFIATVADHRANRGMGGSKLLDDPSNLIAACGVCNGLKEELFGPGWDDLHRRGIRVLRAATSADTVLRCLATPILYRHGDWYLLDGYGGRKYLKEMNRAD